MRGCKASSTLLLAGMFAVLTLVSCQKRTEDATSTKKYATLANLQTAYAAEVKHHRWYIRFIQQANEDRLVNVAALFKAVAQSEQIHANNQAKLIRLLGSEPREEALDSIPLGVTRQLLKLAISSEQFECESFYPMLIQTAQAEKLTEVAKELEQTRKSDACHWELFKDAIKDAGIVTQVQYALCPACGYVATSKATEFCPICSMRKENFEKI